MQEQPNGFALALASMRELYEGWPAFWRIITPWNYVFMAFSLYHAINFPGLDAPILIIAWRVVLSGCAAFIGWNWVNALAGKGARVDLNYGWAERGLVPYLKNMLFIFVVQPAFIIMVVVTPIAMLELLMSDAAESSGALRAGIILGALAILYYQARYLPLAAALVESNTQHRNNVWAATQRVFAPFMMALFVLAVVYGICSLLLLQLTVMLGSMGITQMGVVLLPVNILVQIFFYGAYFLLSYKTYGFIRKG